MSRVDETVVEALGYKMNAQHGIPALRDLS